MVSNLSGTNEKRENRLLRERRHNFSGDSSDYLWENETGSMYKIFVADLARGEGQDPTSGLVATIVVLTTIDIETGQSIDRKEIPLSAIYTNDIFELTEGKEGDGKMGCFRISHEGLIIWVQI